ncbi:MAG: putative sugar nucleotidyl transferase [Balneolaceae bacterium]
MTNIHPFSLFIFEDEHAVHFHPLTLTRPIDDLRIGILTIREKWEKSLNPAVTTRNLRDSLAGVFEQPFLPANQECIFINGRMMPDKEIVESVKSLKPGEGITSGNTFLAGRLDGEKASQWSTEFPDDPGSHFKLNEVEKLRPNMISSVWNLFKINGAEIERDIELMNPHKRGKNPVISSSAILNDRDRIYVGDGAVVEAGAILNSAGGPVFIGRGATVMAGAIVRGPTAICDGATVKMGAKIYENTTVGPVCKVGGEVSNVIFHSYSNKAHDGYAGNSVFGQWCNLGADSNTSNLKNNYATVKFTDWVTGDEIETGEQFLGTIMGDHSKTGINAMLNTGTNCGVCCNLFSDGYPPKHVPSFSWVNSGEIEIYQFEKAVETMERTMARRDVELTVEYIRMMKSISDYRGT